MTDDWRWADEQVISWLRKQLMGCRDDAITISLWVAGKDEQLGRLSRALVGDLQDALNALPKVPVDE